MLSMLRAAAAALLLLAAPCLLSAQSWAADLQANINDLEGGGDFPFLNLVSMGSDGWTYTDNSAHVPPNLYTTDNRGYPQIPMSGPAAFIKCPIPNQTDRAGQYVVVWSGADTTGGTGTHIGVKDDVAEFVPSAGSSSGTLPFTPGYGTGKWVYPTLRGNIPAGFKLAIVHANDLTAYENGEIVGRQYRDRMKNGGFNGLRWMNVTSANNNQIVDSSDLMPVDYASFAIAYIRPAIWSGTSSTSGRVVTVTPYSGFTKVDGAKITFRLNATLTGQSPYNTASNQMLLSVDGGTTQDPIRMNNGRPLWGSYTPTYNAGDMIYAVWDALFGAWVIVPNGGGYNAPGPTGGIPPDFIAQFHRELSAYVGWAVHPYHNVPGMAVDRQNADGSHRDVTDWVSYTANRFKIGFAGTSILPHFEMGNEIWNGMTNIGQWCWAREAVHHPVSSSDPQSPYFGDYDWGNWTGRATSYAGRALDTAYGSDRTKYLFGPGVQQVIFGGGTYPSDGDAQSSTMLSPRLVSETSQGRGEADRAKYWVNAAYISSYWTPTSYKTTNEQTSVDQWSTTTGTAKAAAVQAYADDNQVHSGWLLNVLTNFKAWCLHFGVGTSLIYEGGYSPDYADIPWGRDVTVSSASGLTGQSSITVASTTGLVVGMMYEDGGAGVATGTANGAPLNASITAINSSTVFTVSSPHTGTVSGSLRFAPPLNAFRAASKFVPTLRQWEALHVYHARAAGITRPSMFILGGGSQAWSVFNPDVYANDNTSPRWLGIMDAGPAAPKLFLRMQ